MQAQDNLESYGANILITPQTDDLSLSYGGVTVGAVSVGRQELSESDLAWPFDDQELRQYLRRSRRSCWAP